MSTPHASPFWLSSQAKAKKAHLQDVWLNFFPTCGELIFFELELDKSEPSAVRILREDGSEAPRGELGRIVCKLPMAPGTMTTMFGADERFRKTYFENFKVCHS